MHLATLDPSSYAETIFGGCLLEVYGGPSWVPPLRAYFDRAIGILKTMLNKMCAERCVQILGTGKDGQAYLAPLGPLGHPDMPAHVCPLACTPPPPPPRLVPYHGSLGNFNN